MGHEALFNSDGELNFGSLAGRGAKRAAMKRNFSDSSYWDERYAKNKKERYDWYGTWNSESKLTVKPYVASFMPASSSPILNIGCGNSRFPEELNDDGYTNVVSIDISQAVIDAMS